MVSQRPSLLIDTNVWLDYFLPDRAGGKEAIDLIVFAFEYEFPLLYPAAIVKDVFYVAVSTFKRIARAEKGSLTQSDAVTATETAWGCVKSMRKQATAVGADESDLWTACNLRSVHNDSRTTWWWPLRNGRTRRTSLPTTRRSSSTPPSPRSPRPTRWRC